MNVKEILEKEKEKGNNHIDADGNVVNTEKLKATIKKEYLNGVKEGTIDDNLSLATYTEQELSEYTTVDEMLQVIDDTLFNLFASGEEVENEDEYEEDEYEEMKGE